MDQLTQDGVAVRLHSRFAEIEFPEAATEGDDAVEFQKLAASEILSKVASFLGEFSEFLPSRETFLAAVEKAIDLAFAASPRPFLTNLLKPAAKVFILDAAGSLYDSIANIGTESPEPRTEV